MSGQEAVRISEYKADSVCMYSSFKRRKRKPDIYFWPLDEEATRILEHATASIEAEKIGQFLDRQFANLLPRTFTQTTISERLLSLLHL